MICDLPTPVFYGYMAGKMNSFRRSFMRDARECIDPGLRSYFVQTARRYNHQCLDYIRLARRFSS